MSDNQNSSANSVIYRTPPPPPPPQSSSTSSPSPSPHALSKGVVKNGDSSRTNPAPPQPPVRTNVPHLYRNSSQSEEKSSVLSPGAVNTLSQSNKNNKDTPPTPPSRLINETATNAAARLVYKSAMTGSVQSLNNNGTMSIMNNASDAQNDDQLMVNLSQQIENVILEFYATNYTHTH
jgi:hypothetical protein